jgi:hypothetical protein
MSATLGNERGAAALPNLYAGSEGAVSGRGARYHLLLLAKHFRSLASL